MKYSQHTRVPSLTQIHVVFFFFFRGNRLYLVNHMRFRFDFFLQKTLYHFDNRNISPLSYSPTQYQLLISNANHWFFIDFFSRIYPKRKIKLSTFLISILNSSRIIGPWEYSVTKMHFSSKIIQYETTAHAKPLTIDKKTSVANISSNRTILMTIVDMGVKALSRECTAVHLHHLKFCNGWKFIVLRQLRFVEI